MATVPSSTFKAFLTGLFLSITVGGFAQKGLIKIADLPEELLEISGMTLASDGNFWAINDSGNEPALYKVNLDGVILKKTLISNAINYDWEDLTRDNVGNLYIADIGNNNNNRRDLTVYKVSEKKLLYNASTPAQKITFSYANQHGFPPDKKQQNFDAEALIHFEGSLYIFSKNRTKPYNGYTCVYPLADTAGHYNIAPIDSFITGIVRPNSWITSATLSPDQRHVVLLSHENVWVLSDFFSFQFFSGINTKKGLGHYSQKESLIFLNDTTLLISDEESKFGKQRLYTQNISSLIADVDSLRKYEVSLKNKTFMDSLEVSLHLPIEANVYFEWYDTFGNLLDFDKIGHFKKGENSFFITPKKLINATYLLNVIVADRPHAFMVYKFKPLGNEKEKEDILKLQKGDLKN